MLNWLRSKDSSLPAEQTALVARYKKLRQVGLEQNKHLVEQLSREDMNAGGQKLGILKDNYLMLDTEDMVCVFIDYCLHDVRRQGVNAIERVLRDSPPPAGSDDMLLLEAKRNAYYSLFTIEATEPGIYVHCRDLLRDRAVVMMDVNLSRTARAGVVLATRIFAPEGISMSTGATLPFGMTSPEERAELTRRIRGPHSSADIDNLTPTQLSDMTASIIRRCLQRGAAEHVSYLDAGAVGASPCFGRRCAP
jgi:hypothetical protein